MDPKHCPKPVIGLYALSGTGKTTLLEKILPLFQERGIRVSVIKHAHHSFEIDYPEKDSYRLRKAGTYQILISSKKRWALITEHQETQNEPNLSSLLDELDFEHIDLVIVEGFKHEAIPKIELHRSDLDNPLHYKADTNIIAVATDRPELEHVSIPRLDINNPEGVVDFIISYLKPLH